MSNNNSNTQEFVNAPSEALSTLVKIIEQLPDEWVPTFRDPRSDVYDGVDHPNRREECFVMDENAYDVFTVTFIRREGNPALTCEFLHVKPVLNYEVDSVSGYSVKYVAAEDNRDKRFYTATDSWFDVFELKQDDREWGDHIMGLTDALTLACDLIREDQFGLETAEAHKTTPRRVHLEPSA